MPDQPPALQARHLYVHVPFCARRCSYCDFAIAVRREVPVAEYLSAMEAEMQIRDIAARLDILDSVYLGGGTPSRLGHAGVAALLELIRRHANISSAAEITLEANPDDITVANVKAWSAAGVNRLSIGVQSFDDEVLKWMHRVHSASDALRAISDAREGGIDAFSLDLIFATPESLHRNWQHDLHQAVALRPDHISLYGLTIEPATPLGKWQQRGDVSEAPEERYADEFLLAHDTLVQAGFDHYEVSNFGRPGKRAVHNSAYWKGVPYVGLGPSAHEFDGTVRRWNEPAYAKWVELVTNRESSIVGSETLSRENRTAETVYLGLRTTDGLVLDDEGEIAHVDPWKREGWVKVTPDSDGTVVLRCTPQGWLRLDALAADLTALRSHS